ncbi:polysaccharide deacetylase family protein [Mobilicoccus sp.]|uniref:polysaccharide deacetylase family protein n=1 Tax=Mobilicoccus sp. TaxID=2034349 RepID=UPI0028AFBBA2|nr:polysaccharide deacetylase family protein [Mobilicoccus sp.]
MKRIKGSSVAAVALLVATVGGGAGIFEAERSSYLASQFAPDQEYANDVDAWAQQGVPTPAPVAGPKRDGDSLTFGPKTGTHTLVLFGGQGSFADSSEGAAISAAQLASHFGPVTTRPLSSYRPGMLRDYDALLYVGVAYEHAMPRGLAEDITTGDTPVVWAGGNAPTLAGVTEKGRSQAAHDRFVTRYGWDPAASEVDDDDVVKAVRYKGVDLARAHPEEQSGLVVPHVVDPATVKVLARGVCKDVCASVDADGEHTVPWAVRSANLTFVSEVPFGYPVEGGRSLAYADLLYDALGPDVEPVKQAAVRIEDVSPNTDPKKIREIADVLSARGVPFQLAVIPNFVDRSGATLSGIPRNVVLSDTPELVEALKYAQDRGGVLVQHGTTHQYASLPNPYDGASADDFEFYRAACIHGSDASTYVPCEKDTAVQLLMPIGDDTPDAAAVRVAGGRQLFRKAGLDAPMIFETPHYAASANAYEGIRRVYDTRYERAQFTAGVLTGRPEQGELFEQIFPYRVTDVHGSTVLPETLGSVAPEPYSGHAQRSGAELVETARAMGVVRESTASFFYHAFLPVEGLVEIIDGIEAQGYTFIPATKLR